MIETIIKQGINNLSNLINNIECIQNTKKTTEWITSALCSGNKILICDNGGSAADAQHFAGEFLCRFYKIVRPYPASRLLRTPQPSQP